MKVTTDVDIDLLDRDVLLEKLPHIVARIDREDGYVKHNTGVYFQPIPYDPVTNLATIDHKAAEELGYFKIDFLNNSVYKGVRDEAHLNELANAEPEWSLLDHEEVVENLFHIGNYAKLVNDMKPRSVSQLAMLLAVIRPGKAHLQNKSWDEIEADVWVKPTDGSYYFKRSHATAYAMTVVLHLNLLVEQALTNG